MEIISLARGVKTNNNVSLKTPIKNLSIGVNNGLKEAINKSIKDFKATLFIENLETKLIDEGYEVYETKLDMSN